MQQFMLPMLIKPRVGAVQSLELQTPDSPVYITGARVLHPSPAPSQWMLQKPE